MIPVTKPFLPPREEYQQLLEGIWDREWITNNGPVVQDLERELKTYLGIDNLLFVGNGTIALQFAIKALNITGEVITTPFSYVATTSSLVWEGCKPIFVDIDPNSLNLDPDKIEEAITENTTAILATHVFGNPCDVEGIKEVADKHKLKIIYDAAHCFGTTYKGESVLKWGDISTCSFHATKIFQTVEGGAVFSENEALMERMYFMRNFGHDGPEKFNGLGINGKNSEFHAAMGLVNLKYVDDLLQRRKQQYLRYEDELDSSHIQMLQLSDRDGFNFAYFSAVFESEEIMMHVKKELENRRIYPRRYFYPSLNNLNYVSGETPICESISSRVLCLPLYHQLQNEEQELVINTINKALKNV